MIGPLQAQQVVLRAVCYGAAEVRWVLERVGTEDAPEPTSDPAEEPAGADGTAEADGVPPQSSLHRIQATSPRDLRACFSAAIHANRARAGAVRQRRLTPMTDAVIRRALISVSDKTGLVDFAKALAARGVEILSTGGTAKALKDAGLTVKDVAEHTGFPEMMDGRLKTLHPKVHGGLLAVRDDPAHTAAANAHGIAPIDLLVVNLYPFEATVAKGAPFADCIENIDIGGPAMIRAAAKNHAGVTVVVDPDDYAKVLDAMQRHGGATTLGAAQGAGRQGLRAHGGLRCGHRRLVRGRAGRARAGLALGRRTAGAGAALRREPAPAGGVLQDGRAARRRGDGRAAPGQGAVLQQPQRHGRRLRAGGRVRSRESRRRSPSSSTPTPAAWRWERRWPRPTPRRCAAIR